VLFWASLSRSITFSQSRQSPIAASGFFELTTHSAILAAIGLADAGVYNSVLRSRNVRLGHYTRMSQIGDEVNCAA
jgi:hypothetical protein